MVRNHQRPPQRLSRSRPLFASPRRVEVAVLVPPDSAQIPREVGQSARTSVRWGKIGYGSGYGSLGPGRGARIEPRRRNVKGWRFGVQIYVRSESALKEAIELLRRAYEA